LSSVFLALKNHLLSASSSNFSLEFSNLTFNLFQSSFSGDKPDSHFNKLSSIGSRAEEIGLHPDQWSTGTPPAVLDQCFIEEDSRPGASARPVCRSLTNSLGPCAEAEGSLLKDVQGKSNDVLRTKVRETSRPGASARPEGRGFKLAKHTSSSGSRARAVGLNNKPTGINPAVLDQNSVSQLSSLGPCAEAERWVDKSINGVKRKDDRKSDD